MPASWGYTKERGPDTWPNQYPQAGGSKQSPIDFSTSDCIEDSSLASKPLRYEYDPYKTKVVLNPGYCWKVEVDGEGSILEGGPLEHKYQLEQFHFHWGKTDKTGSEHTVDGRSYPAEAHLVHWNTELYGSYSEASCSDNGLAVLGAFLEIGEEHQELKKLTDVLESVQYSGEETSLPDGFDPTTLLPTKQAFWTYEGSLTTPPCHESVTWIVFQTPIQVSAEQLNQFRALKNHGRDEDCPCDDEFGGQIVENYRPPQPLGSRVVRQHVA